MYANLDAGYRFAVECFAVPSCTLSFYRPLGIEDCCSQYSQLGIGVSALVARLGIQWFVAGFSRWTFGCVSLIGPSGFVCVTDFPARIDRSRTL